MKRLPLVGYSRVLAAASLLIVAPATAWATSITVFGQPTPVTFGLTAAPPDTIPGSTAYQFNLNDYYSTAFPGMASPNPLPQGSFSESELSTNLVLLAGFGPAGPVDPIVVSQSLEFDITGVFWRHHLTLTVDPKSFFIFSSDNVTLKGFVQHLVAPHEGEVAPGSEVNLEARMAGNRQVTLPPSAGSFLSGEALRRELRRRNIEVPADGRFGFDANSLVHPNGPHEDVALAVLIGKTPGSNAETFDWYLGGVSAIHAVPEPSGLILLGSGLAILWRALRTNPTRGQG
jgi:hypothetical protein